MKFRITVSALAAVATIAVAGCSATDQQINRAGTGAAVGALGGALVGQAVGRNTKSTLIGAASGAALGGIVGAASAPQRQTCRYQGVNGVYTAPCTDGY